MSLYPVTPHEYCTFMAMIGAPVPTVFPVMPPPSYGHGEDQISNFKMATKSAKRYYNQHMTKGVYPPFKEILAKHIVRKMTFGKTRYAFELRGPNRCYPRANEMYAKLLNDPDFPSDTYEITCEWAWGGDEPSGERDFPVVIIVRWD